MIALPPAITLKAATLAGAAALVIGTGAGWKLHAALVHQPHLRADAEAARRATEAARVQEAKGVAVSEAVRTRHDTAQAEIHAATRTIIKEVPRYVSSTVTCPALPTRDGTPGQPGRVVVADVSVGFGMLHDAAARGAALPPAASVDLDAARGAGMPAVAATVVDNYGLCRGWRAEVTAWREWYAAQAAAWPLR